MKEVKKGKRIKTFLLGGAFALAALSSAAVLALPVTPAGYWGMMNYHDEEGEIIGQRSLGLCQGMAPVNWGVQTGPATYTKGPCQNDPY